MGALLGRALSAPIGRAGRKQTNRDELELAIAYLHGRVTPAQVGHALGMKSSKSHGNGINAWVVSVLSMGCIQQLIDIAVDDDDDAPATNGKAART